MAQSSVAGRARIIVAEAAQGWRVRHGLSSGAQDKDGNIEHAVADHLAASDLLRTGIEERAVAACRARAKWPTTFIEGKDFEAARAASEAVIAVGREILAAEKPEIRQARWHRAKEKDGWTVHDTLHRETAINFISGLAESEARIIMDVLNNFANEERK